MPPLLRRRDRVLPLAAPLPPAVRALLRALEAAPALVGLYDADEQLIYANPAFRTSFLPGHAGAIGFADILRYGFARGVGVRIECGDVERFIADVLLRRRSVPVRAFEVDLLDGRWIHMTETVLADGFFLSVATDITPLKHQECVLRRAHDSALQEALTDPLTGLPNRRHMAALAQAALQAPDAQPPVLALIDLDHFKRINDAHGHAGGDEALRSFAAYCRRALRPQDRVGRLGGEEFIVLLTDTPLAEAAAAIERLRTRLGPIALGGAAPLHYSFSAGIAAAAPGEGFEALLERADQALYAAKSGGRDRVCLAAVPHAVRPAA